MHTIRLHCEKAVVATLRLIIQLGQLCHDNDVVLFRRPMAYYCNGAAIVLERSSYRVLYQCSTLWRRTKKKVDRTMTASVQLVSVRNVHSVPSTYDASISNQTLHNSRLFPRTTTYNEAVSGDTVFIRQFDPLGYCSCGKLAHSRKRIAYRGAIMRLRLAAQRLGKTAGGNC